MFFERFIEVIEGFNFPDFNRQFIINFITHKAKGLASIFSHNFREFYQTLLYEPIFQLRNSTAWSLHMKVV